jgi:hypothetical protein
MSERVLGPAGGAASPSIVTSSTKKLWVASGLSRYSSSAAPGVAWV